MQQIQIPIKIPEFLPSVIYENPYIRANQHNDQPNVIAKLSTVCSYCCKDYKENENKLSLLSCNCSESGEGDLICSHCYDKENEDTCNHTCKDCNTIFKNIDYGSLLTFYNFCKRIQNTFFNSPIITPNYIKQELLQQRNIIYFPLFKYLLLKNRKQRFLCEDFQFACSVIDMFNEKIKNLDSDTRKRDIKDLFNFISFLDNDNITRITIYYFSKNNVNQDVKSTIYKVYNNDIYINTETFNNETLITNILKFSEIKS